MGKTIEKLDIQIIKEDQEKKSILAQFKERFLSVASTEKHSRIDLLLTMYEQNRITRQEYLNLTAGIGDQKMVIESIVIDNSVKVQTDTTWGGVNVGTNNHSDSSHNDYYDKENRRISRGNVKIDDNFNISRR